MIAIRLRLRHRNQVNLLVALLGQLDGLQFLHLLRELLPAVQPRRLLYSLGEVILHLGGPRLLLCLLIDFDHHALNVLLIDFCHDVRDFFGAHVGQIG